MQRAEPATDPKDQPAPGEAQRGSTGGARSNVKGMIRRSSPFVFFALVAVVPLLRRLRHPTMQGDDITRLVDLIEQPVRDLIFLPFAEHVAPLFQLVSLVTWEAIGHDVRLAPLAFAFASVAAWSLVLVLLGVWLMRETGSRTASFVAVAIVAQSPLVRETAWWYSSSSFSWAVCGILIGVLGAGGLGRRRGSLALIAIGAALAPAGTSLGILAAPLAILRAYFQPGASRRLKLSAALAALAGLLAYIEFCNLGGPESASSARVQNVLTVEPWAGLVYAIWVPGRMLWPSTFGVPASWLAGPLSPLIVWGAGIVALASTLFLVARHTGGNRKLILVGAAMIYAGYLLTYAPRVCMLRMGRWSELQLLYHAVGRYHVLPLMGLAAILAAVIAGWPLVRGCDARRGRPALVGATVGLVMLAVQFKEAGYWDFYLLPQDQKTTLAALQHLGQLAREEGISRAQLVRIIDPVKRPWNESLLVDRPAAFPLVKLAVCAPEEVSHPLRDEEARDRLRARLSARERVALGADMCASLAPVLQRPGAQTVAVARRYDVHEAHEVKPGIYQSGNQAGFIGFEFDPAPEARYLYLPGLTADQDVSVYWCDNERQWRPGQVVRWLKSPPPPGEAVIDLDRLIHLSVRPLSRIVIQFTSPGGVLALDGPPRLLR